MKVVWFEIPVQNLEISVEFYEAVFDINMEIVSMGNERMAMFPFKEPGGALIEEKHTSPSPLSTIIYFHGGSDLNFYLDRVKQFGGKILQPKTQISDNNGWYGVFTDIDGISVGLYHS